MVDLFDVFLRFQYSRRRPYVVNINRKCVYSTFRVGKTAGKTPFVRSRVEDNIKMALAQWKWCGLKTL